MSIHMDSFDKTKMREAEEKKHAIKNRGNTDTIQM